MATRQFTTLGFVLVVLGFLATGVLMHHQNTVAAGVLRAHQTSVKGMRDKLNTLEQMISADRTARAELIQGCKEELQLLGTQVDRKMEGLLVKQELRLIRTLEMEGLTKPEISLVEPDIEPNAHQIISPESPAAVKDITQVIDAPSGSVSGR